MGFHVLGPLRYVRPDGADTCLGGVRQRATLGFLLLHANQTVATSSLLDALWPQGSPVTARKVLQNAVAGLRVALRAEYGQQSPATLITHAPGYRLQLDPREVDLFRFRELADTGAAELAAGSPRRAARLLRQALDLWQGPVLADVAESGIAWPELTAVENSRFSVFEDYFDAELAAGEHQRVLVELETLVAGAPQRERLCRQLMLALYRSGRQVEALSAYRRTRVTLVDKLGLEPGVELRELERAILRHDPALTPRGEPVPVADQPAPAASPQPLSGERKRVSALVVSVLPEDMDPEDVYLLCRQVESCVRRTAAYYGGHVVATTPGTEWRVMFGVPTAHEDDSERAVRAAHAIRTGVPDRVRAAVATGEVLVQFDDSGAPQVIGAVVADALRLVEPLPSGHVRICDATGWEASAAVTCVPSGGRDGSWDVVDVAEEQAARPAADVPMLDREEELSVLVDLMGRAGRGRRPYLAAVLGEPGVGKTRLVTEFQRAMTGQVRCYAVRVPRFGPYAGQRALAALLAAIAGAQSGQPREKVSKLVSGLFDDEESAQLLADLAPLVDQATSRPVSAEALRALRAVLVAAAERRPMAVVIEDLHLADDQVLDFVAEMPDWDGPASLLVVVTARPELARRRREWARSRSVRLITWLDPLSDAAIGRIARAVGGPAVTVHPVLLKQLGGNPWFAVEHARALAAGRIGEQGLLSQSVRNLVASRLDALSPRHKTLLQCAAVVGDTLCAGAVAAVGELDPAETAHELHHLEHLELLRATTHGVTAGETRYEFVDPHLRHAAHAHMTRAVREERRRRATAWLGTFTGGQLVHAQAELIR